MRRPEPPAPASHDGNRQTGQRIRPLPYDVQDQITSKKSTFMSKGCRPAGSVAIVPPSPEQYGRRPRQGVASALAPMGSSAQWAVTKSASLLLRFWTKYSCCPLVLTSGLGRNILMVDSGGQSQDLLVGRTSTRRASAKARLRRIRWFPGSSFSARSKLSKTMSIGWASIEREMPNHSWKSA